MKKRITFKEFLENRPLLQKGDVLEVIREDGKIIATIEGREQEPASREYAFRDLEIGPRPEELTIDPAELIIEEREYERSGKKHGF